MNKRNGLFIVIDGMDGVGKSTQVQKLAERIESTTRHNVFKTNEPTKYFFGRLIRERNKDNTSDPYIDALLFASDRIDHCNKDIIPFLNQKFVVISDRYVYSSIAYQSVYGAEKGITMEWIESINKFAIEPDVVIILDGEPVALSQRIEQRNITKEKYETLDFQKFLRNAYLRIYEKYKNNPKTEFYLINVANKIIETLSEEIYGIIKTIIKQKEPFLN